MKTHYGFVAAFMMILRLEATAQNTRVNTAAGDINSSQADLDRMIRLAPRNNKAYVSRAAVRQQKGDLDWAISDSAPAKARSPATGTGTITLRDIHVFRNSGVAPRCR